MPTFDRHELLPAIVQHVRSGEVLMLGYMNEEALQHTLTSGRVTFWSRSRQTLWQKGETSGHWLNLVEIRQDCDGDALLVLVEPDGPTCHTGKRSCFYRNLNEDDVSPQPASSILAHLTTLIHDRHQEMSHDQADRSYTVRLLQGGIDRIGKKIGEESAEVIIAAKNESPEEIVYESADLMYHLLVLLENRGVSLDMVWQELHRRFVRE